MAEVCVPPYTDTLSGLQSRIVYLMSCRHTLEAVSVRCMVYFTVRFCEGLSVFDVMGLILKTVSIRYMVQLYDSAYIRVVLLAFIIWRVYWLYCDVCWRQYL